MSNLDLVGKHYAYFNHFNFLENNGQSPLDYVVENGAFNINLWKKGSKVYKPENGKFLDFEISGPQAWFWISDNEPGVKSGYLFVF